MDFKKAVLGGILALGLGFSTGCQPPEQAGDQPVPDQVQTPTPRTDDQTQVTPPDGATTVAWAENYDAAVAQARTENKLVLLKFSAVW
jgi:hypothetical protein